MAFDYDDERHPYSAALIAVGLLALWIYLDDDGWLPILDGTNLAFHEAGHQVYGILGQTLGLYGGTLGQLTFPAIAFGIFTYRKHWAQAAIPLAWFGQNLFSIARYMADARANELPLVGGTEHDWYNIFMRWNVLMKDERIAGYTRTLGWMVLASAAGICLWQLRLIAARKSNT
jgi:hypothetical protein